MDTMKKKLICRSLLIALVVSIVLLNIVAAALEQEALLVTEYYFSDEFFANQDAALLLSEELFNATPQDRTGRSIYPSYYGGRFIDENGNLVINVVESLENEDGFQEFDTIISREGVSTQQVQYSYAMLEEIMDIIWEFQVNNPYDSLMTAMQWNGICVFTNRVIVGIHGLNNRARI